PNATDQMGQGPTADIPIDGSRGKQTWLPHPVKFLGRKLRLSGSRQRQPYAEHCTAAGPVLRPYLSVMRLDDGSNDGQSHSHSLLFGGEKGCKNFLELV